jgi:hypothetical protein
VYGEPQESVIDAADIRPRKVPVARPDGVGEAGPGQVGGLQGGQRAQLDIRRHVAVVVAWDVYAVHLQPRAAAVGLELVGGCRGVHAPGVLDGSEFLDTARLVDDRGFGQRQGVKDERLELEGVGGFRHIPATGLRIDVFDLLVCRVQGQGRRRVT